jgi:hypothetical protein
MVGIASCKCRCGPLSLQHLAIVVAFDASTWHPPTALLGSTSRQGAREAVISERATLGVLCKRKNGQNASQIVAAEVTEWCIVDTYERNHH